MCLLPSSLPKRNCRLPKEQAFRKLAEAVKHFSQVALGTDSACSLANPNLATSSHSLQLGRLGCVRHRLGKAVLRGPGCKYYQRVGMSGIAGILKLQPVTREPPTNTLGCTSTLMSRKRSTLKRQPLDQALHEAMPASASTRTASPDE